MLMTTKHYIIAITLSVDDRNSQSTIENGECWEQHQSLQFKGTKMVWSQSIEHNQR